MDALPNKESLKQDLGNFQSSFEFDTTNLTKDRVRNIIKTLEDDRETTTKSKEEDVKINNFLSYLYFLLDDQKHALQLLEESLQMDPDNIIANANKARILLENGEVSNVGEIISKLKELEKRNDYVKRKCYAEAELAYAYARSGPWYNERAVEIFSRIVEVYPTQYTWQFGLGLTLLKRNHPFPHSADGRNKKTTIYAAKRLLAATKSDDPILRAYAYAKLGKAMYTIEKKRYSDLLPEIKMLNYTECFEKALEMRPEDPSILLECGQYARYGDKLDASEELLRKSIQIKPTARGYHHLALTLKRKVENSGKRQTERHHPEESGHKQKQESGHKENSQDITYRRQESGHKEDSLDITYRRQESGHKEDSQEIIYSRQESRHRQDFNHKPFSGGEKSSDPSAVGKQFRRRMIKPPLKVQVYPRNKLLLEAIELINEAVTLSPDNLIMQQDKGIIYRMLGETANAVEVFKQIASKRKCLATKTLMTNVYEQLGLCLLDMSNSEELPQDQRTKYKIDSQTHLSHALQLQSEIVANDPQFKEAWNSYLTLKELLSDKRDGKPKQLAVLHMLIRNHGDAIAIYKELKEKGKMEPEDCKNMLECYIKGNQFEECATLLSSWECTTMFARLPPSLIFDVYVNGACLAYLTNNAQLAYRRFRRAFQVYGLLNKNQTEAVEEEQIKDILLLHTCLQDWRCRFLRDLGTMLEDCTGLRYTINTDDVLENVITTESMVSMMQKIPCIIIMTHDSATKYDQNYVNHVVKMGSEKGGPRVLVMSDDKCNVPDIARTLPFIRTLSLEDITIRTSPPLEGAVQPLDQIPDQLSEIQIKWVKEFVNLLKDQYHK